jgi:chorismate mutase
MSVLQIARGSAMLTISPILAVILTVGCFAPRPVPTSPEAVGRLAVTELVMRMRQRLLVMHDVARWKWNTGQPVVDAEREKQFLDSLAGPAAAHGLDPASVREFFVAQIEAARMIQQADFQKWQAAKQGSFDYVPDLKTELRPRIDQLTPALLSALARARPYLQEEEGRRYLREQAETMLIGEGIDDTVRRRALAPLLPETSDPAQPRP